MTDEERDFCEQHFDSEWDYGSWRASLIDVERCTVGQGFIPTQREIRERAQQVQQAWRYRDRMHSRGDEVEGWTPPGVKMSDVQAAAADL